MTTLEHPPFGAYTPPQWLTRAIHHRNTHSNRVIRYVNKKLAVRYLKFVSRPFDIEVDGIKFRLYPKDNLHDRMAMLSGHLPEPEWYDTLFSGISDGGSFVDIGANVGFFSVVAYARGIPNLKILAIEPHPIMRARLRGNITVNSAEDEVRIEGAAVGAEAARMTLHQPSKNNSGVTTLHTDGAANSQADFEVHVKPLTAILAEHDVHSIDLLKIDIEGYEDRALGPFFEAAERSLWPRSVFIEHDSSARWEVDALEIMTRRGYEIVGRDKRNALLRLVG